MKKAILSVCALLLVIGLSAQYDFKAKIQNKETGEPVVAATITIEKLEKTAIADSSGVVIIKDIPAGKYILEFSSVGYVSMQKPFQFPITGGEMVIVKMEPEEIEEEEVMVQSTRSTRTISDIPTRVEFIAGEELDEKSNMKPGDIRMVLNESTGIQTQQTSATSANASIRIQGLDGRYTQILKDGFPLYAGFSGGLGLLQTPPLDLKQFEVIKGSASTLYGGGAIAGLVNLISKTPQEERELKFHLDATTAGGLNASGFFGQRFNKTGITLFASRNSNSAYDPAEIGLTAIPEFERFTLNPKFFLFINNKTTLSAGVNITTEDRTGGDIDFIKKKKPNGYFETNNSDRVSTQFSIQHGFGKNNQVIFKNSVNHFKRKLVIPAYEFNGTQTGTFTEASYARHGEVLEWVTGINLVTDQFRERQLASTPLRDYNQQTFGVFVQSNWKANNKISIESGIRGDYVNQYGFVFLPRVSFLFKYAPNLTSRIGGGLGYKAPTIFTEESERIQYKNVLAIDEDLNKLERSYGLNADINYRGRFADDNISFSLNHLFFYTRITDPLLLMPDGGQFRFQNINGHFDSKGMETNVKLAYRDYKLFLGYTFTNAYLHEGDTKKENFLTPKHRINSVLLYEVEEKWKLGLEAYYFSRQQLSDGATGKPYWITGFMAEKLWEKFSLYINFENFTDSRQTRFDTIFTGTLANPVFRDIYAPMDGFVVNGGIKLRL